MKFINICKDAKEYAQLCCISKTVLKGNTRTIQEFVLEVDHLSPPHPTTLHPAVTHDVLHKMSRVTPASGCISRR